MRHHSVEVQVPAKINLQLAVGPLESDGYHQLVTVFQAISLYDSVKISRDADEFSISITGDYANAVPADENNLIYKAIDLMAEKHNSQKNVLVEVKRIFQLQAAWLAVARTLQQLFWQLTNCLN